MNTMKRIYVLMLIGFLVLSISGCSKKTNEDTALHDVDLETVKSTSIQEENFTMDDSSPKEMIAESGEKTQTAEEISPEEQEMEDSVGNFTPVVPEDAVFDESVIDVSLQENIGTAEG